MGTERARAAIQVPRETVGFIIGRHGETVRSLSTRSGAFIAVDESPSSAADTSPASSSTGVFNITGTPEQIERARSLISEKVNAILFQPPTAVVSDAIVLSPTTDASSHSTPFRGPSNSNADDDDDDNDQLQEDTTSANISSRAGNGHTLHQLPTSPETQSPSANVTPVSVYAPSRAPLEMWVPSQKVGMVIGQRGQVIASLQDKSGATIVVHNQNKGVDGSKLITISGDERNRNTAKELIKEVLSRDVRSSGPPVLRRSANRAAGPSSRPRHVDRPEPPFAHLVTTPPPPSLPETMSSPPPITPPEKAAEPPIQHPPQPGATGIHPPGYYTPAPVPYGQVPYAPRIHQSPTANPPTVTHYKPVCVPTSCVGIVIGKGGETIRDLQSRSGAYIKVTPDREANANDRERNILITGPPHAVDLAHNLLNDIVNEGLRRSYRDGVEPGGAYGSGDVEQSADSTSAEGSTTQGSGAEASGAMSGAPTQSQPNIPLSIDGEYRLVQQPATQYPSTSISIELNIPNAKVGVIIGKGGQTIRELQQKSGARIVISKKMDMTKEDNPRMVTITGPPHFVETAHALIHAKIRGDPVVGADSVVGTPPGQRMPPSPIAPPAPPDAIQVPIPAMAATRFPGRLAFYPPPPPPPPPPEAGTPFQAPNMAEIQAMRSRLAAQQHVAMHHQMQLQQQAASIQQAFHHQQAAAAAMHMHPQQQPIFQPFPQQTPPPMMYGPPPPGQYGAPPPPPPPLPQFREPSFGRVGEELDVYTGVAQEEQGRPSGESVESVTARVGGMQIRAGGTPQAHQFPGVYQQQVFSPQGAGAFGSGGFVASVPPSASVPQQTASPAAAPTQAAAPARSLPES